jgi:hypothetical protein
MPRETIVSPGRLASIFKKASPSLDSAKVSCADLAAARPTPLPAA